MASLHAEHDPDAAILPDSLDADTCRICRGEASPEEPLFYPCKCSGSIKFVHQDCLMEWLSHSHKKHCELCKTPFRFTKLYHPHMPKTLPTAVFLRRGALHFLSQVLFWCRGLLVFSVWLVLLPWTMRSAWRFMFWFADSGWARTVQMEMSWPTELSSTYPSNHSASSSSLQFASEEQWRNSSSSQPLLFRLLRTFVIGATHSSPRELHFAMTANSTHNSTTHQLVRNKHSSLLSDAAFLRHLTPSVTLNRSIMDVLEGIIITLSVVTAFVLVFLIREWVIQQQPVVNAVPQPAVIAPLEADAQADEHVPEVAATPADDHQANENAVGQAFANNDIEVDSIQSALQSASDVRAAQPASWIDNTLGSVPEDDASDGSNALTPSSSDIVADESNNCGHELIPEPHSNGEATSARLKSDLTVRPDMPARSQSSLAAGTRRTLEESAPRDTNEHGVSVDDPLLAQARQFSNHGAASSSGVQNSSINTIIDSAGKGKERAISPPMSRMPSSRSSRGQPSGNTRVLFAPEPVGSSTHDDISDSWATTHSTSSDTSTPSIVDAVNGNKVAENNQQLTQSATESTAPEVAAQVQHPEPQGWTGRLAHWFWGEIVGLDDGDEDDRVNDEHIVNDVADEDPFVPFEDAHPVIVHRAPAVNEQIQPADAGQIGQGNANNENGDENDADAAEDAEDLEGILELIGMQGPIVGLFQNAIFSTLLIAATIVGTVQLPYMLGRIQLVFLGQLDLMWHIPLHLVSVTADFLADLLLFVGGYSWYYTAKVLGLLVDIGHLKLGTTGNVAGRAGTRLAESLYAVSSMYEPSATLAFSMLSHASLRRIQENATALFSLTSRQFYQLSSGSLQAIENGQLYEVGKTLPAYLMQTLRPNFESLGSVLKVLLTTGTISIPMRRHSLDITDPALAYWNGKDRLAAVLVGYGTVIFWAATYVAYFAPISNTRQYRRLEMAFVEVVQQAGGVFKVIFIISIEMILFPLFCGFLLDLALLPLFANSTLNTRLLFTYAAPWTSGFVHWFVGTCYMFHFALFVSMCRKIMRSGVLYFIRDPDDPTFHPVRDVLERNVGVQLRKIAFSAVVYGTLITVCLGGVVWSLGASSRTILPIRWTSSESEREFPLDILFFNFLTPLVVKYTKPADGLHAMYKWWFHRCARLLSLSSFLFNEEYDDEQYHVVGSWLFGSRPAQIDTVDSDSDVADALVGRYARVPASDQIRIPKGASVFVTVDKDNNRLDGLPDEGTHSSNSGLVMKVHIPPWFKIRIGLFVLAVWFFAAATGLSVTIVPLLFGRYVMSLWYSSPLKINDIYAFALGAYSLGSVIYLAVHVRTVAASVSNRFMQSPVRMSTLLAIGSVLKQMGSIIYVYSAFAVGLPILLAVLLELYILLPLHTYLGRSDTHIVHVVQDWTLGILYVRIFSHFAMAAPTSAPARIAATVLVDGYLRPNARVATKAFILPAILLFSILATVPMLAALLFNLTSPTTQDLQSRIVVLRLAYPTALGAVLAVLTVRALLQATARWRQRIKDEVYLIGERLHNFNEKRHLAAGGKQRAEEAAGEHVVAQGVRER